MNIINKYWSTLGGIIAIGIIAFLIINKKEIFNISSLLWIHFSILLLHQFEEYSFPGKFKEFYNRYISNKNAITRFPLNNQGILVINVVLAWTIYLIAALAGTKAIWLSIGLSGVTILNGLLHTLMFFILKKYNPGLITGSLIFIPFGCFLLFKA